MYKIYSLIIICFFFIITMYNKGYANLYLQTYTGYNSIYGNYSPYNDNSIFPLLDNKKSNNGEWGIKIGYDLNKYFTINCGGVYLSNTSFSKTIVTLNTIQDFSYHYKANYFFISAQLNQQLYSKLYGNISLGMGGLYNKLTFSCYTYPINKPSLLPYNINESKSYKTNNTKILLASSLDTGLEIKITPNLSLLGNYNFIYSLNQYNNKHYKINAINFSIKIYLMG